MTSTHDHEVPSVEQRDLPHGSTRTLFNTYKVMSDHYAAYEELFETYGDTARMTALNGDIIATRNRDYIKQIFRHDPMGYDPFAADATEAITGKGSVFSLTGKEHTRQRKLLMPCFHGDRMRAYGDLMHDAARAEIERVLSEGQGVFAGKSSIYPMMNRISMEVIIRAVFGVQEEARVEQVHDAITKTMDAISPIFLFSKGMQREFFGVGPFAKFKRHMDRANALLYDEMDRKESSEGASGEDILSLLLAARDEKGDGLSREVIRDHLITLLAAGHETTAISMTWAIYHLLRHPKVMERARREIDEAFDSGMHMDGIAKLPYLTAVWKETLRIHPILPDVLRTLKRPMDLGPYHVEAGKVVSVAISAVHHDPDVFDEPETFKPERFLERRYKPWEFMPFGGGHRRCIGAAFAGYEMGIVLATWLRLVDTTLLEERDVVPKRRGLTIATSSPVQVKIERRAHG